MLERRIREERRKPLNDYVAGMVSNRTDRRTADRRAADNSAVASWMQRFDVAREQEMGL